MYYNIQQGVSKICPHTALHNSAIYVYYLFIYNKTSVASINRLKYSTFP